MNIFDRLLTQPIFNLLALIYNFVADFGVAIIIMTILVRLLLWPLVKKQLHQTKLMRAIQPELKQIKKKTKGNRMLESQMMMELYRERGIKPPVCLLRIPLPYRQREEPRAGIRRNPVQENDTPDQAPNNTHQPVVNHAQRGKQPPAAEQPQPHREERPAVCR